MSLRVHFLNGGHCRHLLASIDGRTFRTVQFHAVLLAIEHPSLGWIVCDTGYGGRFLAATSAFPSRLYRWATPVSDNLPATSALARIGLHPADIRHLIITHFHADHIGGLRDFPQARVYFHEHALAPLLALKPFRQTRAAFLPSLLPDDLASRSHILPDSAFLPDARLPFRSCDLLGDSLLKAVFLPGHAPGQIGLEFTDTAARERPTLYCADAFWRSEQLLNNINLPRLTRSLQWDGPSYLSTINHLRTLARADTHRLLACHDDITQRHVAPS
ncbi:MBL fold metallo-hydrolase [Nibricoccus aquaticus]|uniref:MBL fold metallo-hydrolase n=1 Tax=Nibricoccus aquaticus TaxID=2576891 RepID=A0A290Q587_9BACT|nr:MBL fold metallo-hydrolase [Nibricoccus aquaticus]ATC63849.1 MBL fold metallo-hydrolase [Nibricoccus aquaticus]